MLLMDNFLDDSMLEEETPCDVDPSTLTPLTPWLMRGQATINVGTIGHVAHGKSTVVKALSGVTTVRFRNELVRNITIKLGYANAKIFRCDRCPRPQRYSPAPSHAPDEVPCPRCGGAARLARHVSFVDCPGHDVLMATMLGGAAAMDAALLLVAAGEPCPQPQTAEHLAAVEIMRLRHLLVLQNKVDLVTEAAAKEHHRQIRDFLRGTVAESAPVLPISAQLGVGVDVLCEYLATRVPVPPRDFSSAPRMIVLRSFDVNRPGCEVEALVGGVAGGTLQRGLLQVGDVVELRPGLVTREGLACRPLRTRVESLFAERNALRVAAPGGLVGAGLRLDPSLARADRLVGQALGRELPPVLRELELHFHLLRRLLGAREARKVARLVKGEVLMVNVGALTTGARVLAVKADLAKVTLTQPVCTEVGEKLTLSRRIEKHWRLIGWGTIKRGARMELEESE